MSASTGSGASAQAEAPDPPETPAARSGWRYGVPIAVLIVGLLLGLAGGLLVPRLTRPGDASVEAGFLRDMSTHHAQAVEMAMIAHAATDNVEIRSLAADITMTQHGQIGMMQTWLREWKLDPTGSDEPMAWMPDAKGSVVDGLMPGMATPEQLRELRSATGKALDAQFLTLMRSHHLGGIHMAQEIVRASDDEDVTWLAQTMVNSQQGEMNVLTSLLKQVQGTA
jgi:uncharacterized protein (DUF305 family)